MHIALSLSISFALFNFHSDQTFRMGAFARAQRGHWERDEWFCTSTYTIYLCVRALQSPYTSRSSGASSSWWQKAGKYLLCFHLVFALWSTQLCVYMQFVQEGAICVLLMCGMHTHTHTHTKASLRCFVVFNSSIFAAAFVVTCIAFCECVCVCHEFSA